MTGWAYLKAFGIAVLLMVLNIAASFVVMAVYGHLIDPGHEPAYYETAAQSIAPWSSVFVGALLFFAAAWLLGVRKPARPALIFALTFTLIYTMIDLIIVAAIGVLMSVGHIMAISIASKFAAAFLGARMVKRMSA